MVIKNGKVYTLCIVSLVKQYFKILFSDLGALIALFRRKEWAVRVDGGGGRVVKQGLKLPFENSCFDFLIAFSRQELCSIFYRGLKNNNKAWSVLGTVYKPQKDAV